MERASGISFRATLERYVTGIALAFPDGIGKMSRNGGQASGTALRADCNIIWLPGIAPVECAGAQARCATASTSVSRAHPRFHGWALYTAAAAVCLGGQAAALPMLAAAGAGAGPWATGAAFGAAAAIASWAGAKIAGSFAKGTGSGPGAAPQDLALHDAFTLSLILAASAVLGGIGAALLLPAGAALALATRRIARKRPLASKTRLCCSS